jgi:hypothetical protein
MGLGQWRGWARLLLFECILSPVAVVVVVHGGSSISSGSSGGVGTIVGSGSSSGRDERRYR